MSSFPLPVVSAGSDLSATVTSDGARVLVDVSEADDREELAILHTADGWWMT